MEDHHQHHLLDVDSVANKLHDLRLQRPSRENSVAAPVVEEVPTEWVDFLLKEMMSASGVDDARARASRVLKHLRRSSMHEGPSVAEAENVILKERIQVNEERIQELVSENCGLKSAVVKQHELQKELEGLKQVVVQYQSRVGKLEVDNYGLTAHLKQALQSSPIQFSRSNLDVF